MKTLKQYITRRAWLYFAILSPQLLHPYSLPATVSQLQIPQVATAPRISDYLEGRERSEELRVSGFRQRDPRDGQPAIPTTTAFLSYDDHSIYAVFVCNNATEKPRAHLSRRDNLSGDETVSFMLDTLHDRRHACEFTTNPLGVQMDGLITEGQEEDFNFDTLWR